VSVAGINEYLTEQNQFVSLPVGSRVYDCNYGHRYLLTGDGWVPTDGGPAEPTTLRWERNKYQLTYIPYDKPETLRQYQWRYMQVCLQGAESHSIDDDTVQSAFDEMGLPVLEPGPGAVVRSWRTRADLPEGTLVFTGDPEEWQGFNVYRKAADGTWRRVLGDDGTLNNRGTTTVVSIPGQDETPAWITQRPTKAQAAMVAKFKQVAWRVGREFKEDNEWCGTYEAVVAQAHLIREDYE